MMDLQDERQVRWNALYEQSDQLLRDAAIVELAAKFATSQIDVWSSMVDVAWRLRQKGVNMAATLVPCNYCKRPPTFKCQTRDKTETHYSHKVRIDRAEAKGFIPKMTVHVHADNLVYRIIECAAEAS
jgi:hypothetical protein